MDIKLIANLYVDGWIDRNRFNLTKGNIVRQRLGLVYQNCLQVVVHIHIVYKSIVYE